MLHLFEMIMANRKYFHGDGSILKAEIASYCSVHSNLRALLFACFKMTARLIYTRF